MKRFNLLFSLFFIAVYVSAQDYYWYKNQKIFLEQGDEQYVLFRPDTKAGFDATSYIKTGVANDTSLMWGIQKKNVFASSDVKYVSPSYFIKSDSSNIYVTERFYVKLMQKEDYDVLVRFANEHNVTIVKEGAFSPWYVLACTEQSNGNALQMANLFYESSLFASAEPEFINTIRFACEDDHDFDEQWNLLNTGQNGANYTSLDINYCGAHALTSGVDSIIIAVIDHGVNYHIDLSTLVSLSYDAETGTSPSKVYSQHGTYCAGIIGAKTEGTVGTAGIAPNCPILPISVRWYTSSDNIANGIRYAVENNAAVLNNSWYEVTSSDLLNTAIDSALVYGRNGKGCVVVFAVGNGNNNSLSYPANSNPSIIAVGAMAPNGERKKYNDVYNIGMNNWGSNYGQGLDIMAPGVEIPTTEYDGLLGTTNYHFNGTSAACPHVAAVAGLVLSINPNLTQKEVADIIESTAQKVGGYNYDSIAPNGTWNMEMGYGLVDAYAAVKKAQLSLIEIDGSTYLCDTSCYYARNVPENATIEWHFDQGRNFQYDTIGYSIVDSVIVGIKYGITPVIPGEPKGGFPNRVDPGIQIPKYATLSVTVTKDGLQYTKEKRIYPKSWGVPSILASDTASILHRHTELTFSVNNCAYTADEHIEWTITRTAPFGPSVLLEGIGREITYTFGSVGHYDITVTNAENLCGNQSATRNIVVTFFPGYFDAPSKNLIQGDMVQPQKQETQKILRNGQLFILQDDRVYNAEGALIK